MEMESAMTEAALTDLAARYSRLWFVPYPNSVWDPDNVVGRWLADHLLEEEKSLQDRLTLLAYRPLHSANELLHPVGIETAAEDVRLEGVYTTIDGQRADLSEELTLRPGAIVAVTLMWETLGAIPGSYTVFVHLLDDSGHLLAQHDGIPVAGTRPTSTWHPGERLFDRHELVVPDAAMGKGRMVIGLYDSTTLQRMPFAGGADAIAISDVQFEE
jgi:hypothetical protein